MIGNPRRYIAVLLLSSAVLFFLDSTGALSKVGNGTRAYVFAPVFERTHRSYSAFSGFFSPIFSIRKIVQGYGEMLRERDYFRGEYLRLASVEEENEFLRQALQLEGRSEGSLVLAHVVGFDPLGGSEVLLIDKGSRDGIAAGQGVVSHGRTFVGYIVEVSENSGRVLLVTSERARVAAILQGTGTHVTLQGSPTGALSLELIPKDTAILEGELVLTSGIGGTLPPNLLIGEVRRVIDAEAASFKRAVVEPFVDARGLSQVFIISAF